MSNVEVKMIVGLGNPGEEYIGTRHNVGFTVIDSLSKQLKVDLKKRKFGAAFGQSEFEDKKLILLKPQQYMNCSGQVVATAAGFYKLSPNDLLVVTDDMALEPGRIRIRARGSAGGHNGLADIIEKLGSCEFGRLRIGIGRDVNETAHNYVLDKPTDRDRPLIEAAIVKAQQAVICWVRYGVEAAMNEFNAKDEI